MRKKENKKQNEETVYINPSQERDTNALVENKASTPNDNRESEEKNAGVFKSADKWRNEKD